MATCITPRSRYSLRARDKSLELGHRTAIMGVINVTPDSFFKASRFPDPTRALAAALDMTRAGAQIIDIGGESTRPGAEAVSLEEEIDRVLPVVTEMRRKGPAEMLLSVDTRSATVAEKVLDLGADIINDVSGGGDPRTAEVVARAGAGLILMHMKGTPRTMQKNPRYLDVVREVIDFLSGAVRQVEAAGVSPASIVVDPGIGFGKTVQHNLQLLSRLDAFSCLEKPILVGTSRKSFIGKVLGNGPKSGLYGTAATLAISILGGAHLVRVHDVAEMAQVARMTDAILNEEAESNGSDSNDQRTSAPTRLSEAGHQSIGVKY